MSLTKTRRPRKNPGPPPRDTVRHDTFFLSCFVSPRRRFDSTKRRLVALERFALRRRFLETSARCDWRAATAAASSLAANKRFASARLRAWDRDALTRTEIPVGTWRSVTAVETLLTCWPPGPPDRQKTSSTSSGRHTRIPRPSRQIGSRTSPGVTRQPGGTTAIVLGSHKGGPPHAPASSMDRRPVL